MGILISLLYSFVWAPFTRPINVFLKGLYYTLTSYIDLTRLTRTVIYLSKVGECHNRGKHPPVAIKRQPHCLAPGWLYKEGANCYLCEALKLACNKMWWYKYFIAFIVCSITNRSVYALESSIEFSG